MRIGIIGAGSLGSARGERLGRADAGAPRDVGLRLIERPAGTGSER
jgi:ketopantoate reductase